MDFHYQDINSHSLDGLEFRNAEPWVSHSSYRTDVKKYNSNVQDWGIEVYVSHPNALKWNLSTFMKIDFELLFQLKPEFESFLTIISEKTILEVNDVIWQSSTSVLNFSEPPLG